MKRLRALLPLLTALLLGGVFLAFGITQEVPVGSVEGRVTMAENGKPLPKALVVLSPIASGDDLPERRVFTGSDGRFHVRGLPASLYRISVSAKAHEIPSSNIEVEEGKQETKNLELTPKDYYLELYSDQHVFTPDDQPSPTLSGFVKGDTVDYTVTKLDLNVLAKNGGIEETLSPLNDDRSKVTPGALGQIVKQESHHIAKKDAEGLFHERLDIARLTPGLYWVQCQSGDVHKGTYLNITQAALITKSAGNKTLAYAVDIQTGRPLAGADVFVGSKKGSRHAGTTDANGIAEVTADAKDKNIVYAKSGESVAVCGLFGDEEEPQEKGPDTVFLYTDRSIYRPGDEIQFKGIVRHLNGDSFSLPKPGPVTVKLLDSQENVVGSVRLVMGGRGVFHGSFTTSREAEPSEFKIEAETPHGKGQHYVPIADYRKPDFTIAVRPGKPYYVLGDKAKATIECSYYYGGPVVGAKVKADVYRQAHWEAYDDSGDDQAADAQTDQPEETEFAGGEYEQSVEATTDANGRAVIEFPTRGDNDPDVLDSDYDYSITASVADEGDKYFTGEGTVRVVRGSVALKVAVDRYIAAVGDTVDVSAKVTTQDASAKPVPNAKVRLVVGSETWKEKDSVFTAAATYEVATDDKGVAHFPVTIGKEESLRLRASVLDSEGRTVRDDQYIWVDGSGYEAFEGDADATTSLVVDRGKYNVGDTAKVLIQTTVPGGSALLTVEADGILRKQVVALDKKSKMVLIPLDVSMAPNAYVNVSYIHGVHYMESTKSLTIDRHDKDLQVTVSADRQEAKPGEVVAFSVETKDPSGKPISADTSLAVVDESLYAVRHDTTNIRGAFYPGRSDKVITTYSFPEIYLDGGDKGSGEMPVRSRFLDTAAWVPDVQTGADGKAVVKVRLPDNLTRWRATVVGCTDDATVGMSTGGVTARKDLMVRVNAPSYLVAGDRQKVSVVVTNDTGENADVALKLDLKGLENVGDVPSKIFVRTGKPESIDLDLEAVQTGTAAITAQATLADGTGDAVRMSFPVNPHGREIVEAHSGDTTKTNAFSVTRLADADPNTGRLRLVLSPSIASSLVRSLDDLVGFPYGCAEQTMSRFMPSILVDRAVKKAGLPPPKLEPKIRAIATDSFTRLARMQHQDGGWGWWDYDQSDLGMTALVLDGLKRAEEAGYPTPAGIRVSEALKWAGSQISASKLRHDESRRDRIYLAYAIARYGQVDDAKKALHAIGKFKATTTELALLALAHAAVHEPFKSDLDELRKRAIVDGSVARWPQDRDPYDWNQEPDAFVLVALTTLAPDDPLIPELARGLMAHRIGYSWTSTRETSYVLIGMTAYLARMPRATGPFLAAVKINGKEVKSVRLDPKSVDQPDTEIEAPIASLVSGANKVEIVSEGNRPVFYSADLRQVQVSNQIDAISSPGFTIQRRYFVMEARQLENGTMRLLPSTKPIDQAKSGSIIRCELTIESKGERNFLMVECPTPSNCRIVEREDPEEGAEWSWWWSRTVVRSDRIAFFSTQLPAGVSHLAFNMRAESPGAASSLPAVADNMYNPADRTETSETPMTVTP